jgi:hypothetical protein
MADGDVVMWATVLGLLVGIVWSLRYVVIIDRKIDRILRRVEGETKKEVSLERKQLAAERRQTALLKKLATGKRVTKPRKTTKRKTKLTGARRRRK